MLKSRQIGRQQEFIHNLKRCIENKITGPNMVVVTSSPEKIQDSLANIGCNTDFEPVYEGILGLDFENPKREKDYTPEIIGYKFNIVND